MIAIVAIAACAHPRESGSLPADLSRAPPFFDALLEPSAGRVIHGWGQFSSAWAEGAPEGRADADDLDRYLRTLTPYKPAMLSFYVAPDPAILASFLERYGALARSRGFFVAEVGLYFQSFQGEVANGKRDRELHTLADGLRDAGLPVLLRIGYEFNNPWALYDPQQFSTAFRRVVAVMRQERARNVAAVWNATAAGLPKRPWMDWYPGDDFVDWWSVNLFRFQDFTQVETGSFLDDARRHRKPVLIGEAAPILESVLPWRVRGPTSDAEAARWYGDLIELIRRRPEVKAVSLIAVNWRRLRSILPGWGWPDTRLDRWPAARQKWRSGLGDYRFVHQEEAERLYAGAAR